MKHFWCQTPYQAFPRIWSIHLQEACLFIQFVLDPIKRRDLDEGIDQLGRAGAHFKAMPGVGSRPSHCLTRTHLPLISIAPRFLYIKAIVHAMPKSDSDLCIPGEETVRRTTTSITGIPFLKNGDMQKALTDPAPVMTRERVKPPETISRHRHPDPVVKPRSSPSSLRRIHGL